MDMNEPRGLWLHGQRKQQEGGAGLKGETISDIIFHRLLLFEHYYQSVMSHCGSRIMLNNAAGGVGVVLYIQADIQGSFGQTGDQHWITGG